MYPSELNPKSIINSNVLESYIHITGRSAPFYCKNVHWGILSLGEESLFEALHT